MDQTELRAYLREVSKMRGIPMMMDRFRSDSIASDGLKLHLDVIDVNRKAPTVVFVPGTTAYALLYQEFLVALADAGYNVVGLDPRGHGQSEGEKGSYTVMELVRDTRAAIAYARYTFSGPVAVAGSSQGGIAAFYLAATDEKVAGAVCHNVADLGDPSSVELTRNPTLSRIMKPILLYFAKLMPEMKIPISLYLDLSKEEMKGYGNAQNFLDKDPLVYRSIRLKGLASLASEKLPRPVEEITTPILILHAGKDNIFPQKYVEGIYNRLKCRKSLKIYPDLPHLILTEHVDIVMPDVKAWLEEIFRQ